MGLSRQRTCALKGSKLKKLLFDNRREFLVILNMLKRVPFRGR